MNSATLLHLEPETLPPSHNILANWRRWRRLLVSARFVGFSGFSAPDTESQLGLVQALGKHPQHYPESAIPLNLRNIA